MWCSLTKGLLRQCEKTLTSLHANLLDEWRGFAKLVFKD
jgi:hypothetical protein